MSTATESLTAVATSARQATEKSLQVFTDGAKTITDQVNRMTELPKVDLAEPVNRYFDYLQRSIDFNRGLAATWAEVFGSLAGTVYGQTKSLTEVATDQTKKVADLTVKQAEKLEQATREQATKVEEAEKEQARLTRQAERAEAKLTHQRARAPYEELTKAELAAQLEGRSLPKSGTVEELIERLVSADSL